MAIKTIEELFIHELSDIYSAEKQLTKSLPRLARAATEPKLVEAFKVHLEETQGQIERIDQIVELLGIKLKRIKCAAMEGLVEEGREVIEEIEAGPVRDAALIGGAQKVEHYEIASYGTIAAIAKQLGYSDAITLLLATLDEEKATDEKLTLLAEQGGNQKHPRPVKRPDASRSAVLPRCVCPRLRASPRKPEPRVFCPFTEWQSSRAPAMEHDPCLCITSG